MATANAKEIENSPVSGGAMVLSASVSGEGENVKAVRKRYDGLTMVRTKAVKGKGAWYWAHLEPVLHRDSETGLPTAVKLRCLLCDAAFSASNPSRTASEHLKRGTCPNFVSAVSVAMNSTPNSNTSSIHTSPSSMAKPIAALLPCSSRKRSSSSCQVCPLAVVDPSRFPSLDMGYYSSSATPSQHLTLSGGKEDLGALAMLEDSLKKLKSPKACTGTALTKVQVESAISLLADWVYESSGAVSFSSIDHPKFRSFLQQVGLPPIPRGELTGARLDARYEECWCESEARIQDAMFFQVASDGWRPRVGTSSLPGGSTDDRMVAVTLNLPNGTSVFRKAVFANGRIPSKYAEEVLWETITGVCGGTVQRCAGIVADRFKSKALRELEKRHHWMVNLSCQRQGFNSLIKDFAGELPVFRNVAGNCSKLVHFFNTNSRARSTFRKYQVQDDLHQAGLLRAAPFVRPPGRSCGGDFFFFFFSPVFSMMEDVMASYGALHSAVSDESYEVVDDPVARELAEMVRDVTFWSDLEAVHSLVVLVRTMAREMEAERPLVGQCLGLWNELRSKVKNWCAKYNVDGDPVEALIDKRFQKNYHPAWSAAFILDPFYLTRDASSGKYLPPFKCLTPEQEKDVDKLITRLVPPEEAHVALMELMKWRSEGLDAVYAQAVQMKQRDPTTGKMKIANPQSSRLVWETYLCGFKLLRKVAIRVIFLQATACGFKCNLSLVRWVGRSANAGGMDVAQKMAFIAGNAKLERRDFSSEEETDSQLFANGVDDVLLNGALPDAA